MKEYYFLFAIALIATFIATIQDIKKREVANWLNFTLLAIGISYRLFYSIINNNYQFLLLGILGTAVMILSAYALYYGKAFAGGDAKLLMGYGPILPYVNLQSAIYTPLIFLFALFLIGAVYSIGYSAIIIKNNKSQFKKEFSKSINKNKFIIPLTIILSLIAFFLAKSSAIFIIPSLIIALTPILFIYLKSIDKCMIKLIPPKNLAEGDWLEKEIIIGKHKIKKTVHGLSIKDIQLLRKHNKKALIKEGIPFVPAFLISLIMVSVFLVLQYSLEDLILQFF